MRPGLGHGRRPGGPGPGPTANLTQHPISELEPMAQRTQNVSSRAGKARLTEREISPATRCCQADRKYSATRPCGPKGIGGCDATMKLRTSSIGCKSHPARGEPARAGSK